MNCIHWMMIIIVAACIAAALFIPVTPGVKVKYIGYTVTPIETVITKEVSP